MKCSTCAFTTLRVTVRTFESSCAFKLLKFDARRNDKCCGYKEPERHDEGGSTFSGLNDMEACY